MKDELILNYIANSIRNAGYDPYSQLRGYLNTGNVAYITRQGDARNLIRSIDYSDIEAFVKTLNQNQS